MVELKFSKLSIAGLNSNFYKFQSLVYLFGESADPLLIFRIINYVTLGVADTIQ